MEELTKDMIPQLVSYFNSVGRATIPIKFYHAYKKEIEKELNQEFYIKGYKETIEIRSKNYPFKDFLYSDLISSLDNFDLLNKLIDEEIDGLPIEIKSPGPYKEMFKILIATEVNSLMSVAKISNFKEALNSISGFYIRDRAHELLDEYNSKGERIK